MRNKLNLRLLPCLGALLICAATAVLNPSRAQTVKDDKTPIRPIIPDADRDDDSRVFLEHANELISKADIDYQILVGDVQFRRSAMFMYCDSAHFYDQTGSFDAFGNVRMEQGDTLFIYADELNYNDSIQLAVLYADEGKKVRLINRNVTLTTDVFNYDMAIDLGYYDVGGQLTDDKNRLTSLEGEYNPTSKEAIFRHDVHLTSHSQADTMEIFSDDLYYNTDTHIAILTTESKVINADGIIYTTNGIYNTKTTASELYDRSLVVASNGNTLTGDTLYYNRNEGWGQAFGNIEICDTTNKMIMHGQYGFYNELTDSALVTGKARAIEYPQGDSLYIHGDTIRSFNVVIMPDTTTSIINKSSLNESFSSTEQTDSIAVTDSIPTPDSITPFDSIVAPVDSTLPIAPVDSIVAPVDSTLPIAPVDSIAADLKQMPDSVAAPASIEKTEPALPDTVRYIIAAPQVKFFRTDIQGLCDSMTFVSKDTTIYMNFKPIIWSDNRQVTGDVIQIHLNDSTVDRVKVPTNAFLAEKIEDGYFNQLSGKEMITQFVDGHLRHLDMNGNVLAITFPEEEDSTINKVASIESSFLAADFHNNAIEKMKLWSETNATVTPLYLAKKSILFLQAFKWFEVLRPYNPDDIFTFPDNLIKLFDEARQAEGVMIPKRRRPVDSATKSEENSDPTAE
ncbi:MAG: hypothetical protein J6R27_01885 [Muribaculaceae bacterium]|nr:hypothetical protein [Muribaculaceae bacterium]